MTPLRKVTAALGALVLLLALGRLALWKREVSALERRLSDDVQATLARPIELPPRDGAVHDEAFACVAAAVAAAPGNLTFVFDQQEFERVISSGVTPLPDALLSRRDLLTPWANGVRGCGDARLIRFGGGLTPFTLLTSPLLAPYTGAKSPRVPADARVAWEVQQGLSVLMKVARLEVLASPGDPSITAERCVGTLEVALQLAHLGLDTADESAKAVHQLAGGCGRALTQLEPGRRAQLSARYEALVQRLPTNQELLELERQRTSLSLYGSLLNDELRGTVPQLDTEWGKGFDSGLGRLRLLATWPRFDAALRTLMATADTPGPARDAAGAAVDRLFAHWWLPGDLRPVTVNRVEDLLVRNEHARVLLRLLAHLSGAGPLPAEVRRTPGRLEFTPDFGPKLVLEIPER